MSEALTREGLPQAHPDEGPQEGSTLQEERRHDGSDQDQAGDPDQTSGTDTYYEDLGWEQHPLERKIASYKIANTEAHEAEIEIREKEEILQDWLQIDATRNRTALEMATIAEQQAALSVARGHYRKKRAAMDDAFAAVLKAEETMLRKQGPHGEHSINDSDNFYPSKTDVFTPIFPKELPPYAYDPAELRDPEAMDPIPFGARRWRFSNEFWPSDVDKARTKIANILENRRYDVKKCIVTFPARAGQHYYVQIYFHWTHEYKRSRNLRLIWKGKGLELISSSVPLRIYHQTVLKINDVLRVGDDKVLTEIFDALGKFMNIETMWRLDHTVELRDGPETVRGASILAVAQYHFKDKFYWQPHQTPGWIQTSNGTFQVHFLGRQPSCVFCRQTKVMPYYHTTEECALRTCPLCEGNGHSEVKCPLQSKKRSRNGEIIYKFCNVH